MACLRSAVRPDGDLDLRSGCQRYSHTRCTRARDAAVCRPAFSVRQTFGPGPIIQTLAIGRCPALRNDRIDLHPNAASRSPVQPKPSAVRRDRETRRRAAIADDVESASPLLPPDRSAGECPRRVDPRPYGVSGECSFNPPCADAQRDLDFRRRPIAGDRGSSGGRMRSGPALRRAPNRSRRGFDARLAFEPKPPPT